MMGPSIYLYAFDLQFFLYFAFFARLLRLFLVILTHPPSYSPLAALAHHTVAPLPSPPPALSGGSV